MLKPILTLALLTLIGCKAEGGPIATAPKPAAQPATPPRPTVPPPPFKVFHHDATSFTLVTKENATNDEIAAILWQLRDATRDRTFDKLHISQKDVDARDPMLWFHLYRGVKCASEKYAPGHPPCGTSYHAAADFTYGGFANHNHTAGVLLKDEDHQIALWPNDDPQPTLNP